MSDVIFPVILWIYPTYPSDKACITFKRTNRSFVNWCWEDGWASWESEAEWSSCEWSEWLQHWLPCRGDLSCFLKLGLCLISLTPLGRQLHTCTSLSNRAIPLCNMQNFVGFCTVKAICPLLAPLVECVCTAEHLNIMLNKENGIWLVPFTFTLRIIDCPQLSLTNFC